MEKLNDVYNKYTVESSRLYTGPVYVEQTYLKKGSPFLASDTMSGGWIVYDHHFYPSVAIQWDVYKNYVLVRSLGGFNKVILNNDLIDSFYIAGHLVQNMQPDEEKNLANGGLYELIYTGDTEVIVKRKKENKMEFENSRILYRFYEKNIHYVKKGGIYYRVNNKKDVLRLYGSEYQSAIKREIRRHGLNWRRDFEQCLIAATSYYDKVNDTR